MHAGVCIEALDGRTRVRPGDVATLRLQVTGTNGHDVPVHLDLAAVPMGWDVRLGREEVRVGKGQPAASVGVAVAVPEEADRGDHEVVVEASHRDGRTTVAFPLEVVGRVAGRMPGWARRLGLAGLAGGVLAASGWFAWRRRRR